MATPATARCVPSEFANDVRLGLTKSGQKELPSKYFYDAIGSALFEVITLLPEYGLTRADEHLLRRNADAMVRSFGGGRVDVAELGSGSGKKTRWILEAVARRHHANYFPIEISPAALAQCTTELNNIDGVDVIGVGSGYLEGLASIVASRRTNDPLIVLFLGSTIGNFDRPAAEVFLEDVRRSLRPGDALLLGTDLVKPVEQLLRAYDDPLGVTAAFNLNLLARINRELGADFDLGAFAHLARYDVSERRIEMHLMSRQDQHVSIPDAGCAVFFHAGETIWTESSYKYHPREVFQMARQTGFRVHGQWLDEEWPFAETLLIAE